MKANYNNNLEQIDQLAKTVLTDYEVPFEAMNWALMEEALDKKYVQPTNTVWFVKGVELLLMVATISAMLYFANDSSLLLMQIPPNSTMPQTAPMQELSVEQTAGGNEAMAVGNSKTVQTDMMQTDIMETGINGHAKAVSRSIASKTAPTTILIQKTENAIKTNTSTHSKTTERLIETTPIHAVSFERPQAVQTKQAENQQTDGQQLDGQQLDGQRLTIEAAPTIIRDAAGNIIQQFKRKTTPETRPEARPTQTRVIETLDVLPNLQPSLLQNKLDIPAVFQQRIFASIDESTSDDAPYEITKRAIHPFSIGIVGSGDYNSVLQNSYDGIKLTQGFGQTVGVRFLYRIAKRFGLDTGIFGSFKNYTASTNFATASPANQVVQKTSLNVVQVPLNIVIDAFQNPEWRVYTKAGVTYQLVATGNYEWRDGSSTDFNLLTNNVSVSPAALGDTPNRNNVLAADKNNALLLNIGMGVSYRIARRISILCEPTYQHALKGIGNHSDMINTVSLTVGASYVL